MLALTPFSFPEMIDGPRIVLRKHVESLAPEMFHLVELNRARLTEFMPWPAKTKTVKDARSWILDTRVAWKDGEMFDYGLFLKATGAYIGSVGLHTIHWDFARGEFGYWLGAEFQGHGYLSEAITLLEKVAFKGGFVRLEIRCDPNNLLSTRVAERLHYQKEGHLRQDMLIGGVRRDTLVFGKLRSEATF